MESQRVQSTTTTTISSNPTAAPSSLSSSSSSSSSSTTTTTTTTSSHTPSTTSYISEKMREAALKTKQAIGEAATQIKQSIEHATAKPDQFNCEHCSALLIAPQTTSTLSTSGFGSDMGGGVSGDWWQCSRPDCQFSTNRKDSKFCVRCGTAREVIGSSSVGGSGSVSTNITQKGSAPPLKVICSVCNKETKVPSTNAENQIKAQFHAAQRTTSKLYLDLSQQDYVLCPRCKAPIKLPVKPKLASASTTATTTPSSSLPSSTLTSSSSSTGNVESSNLPAWSPPASGGPSSTTGQQPASMHSTTFPSMNFTPTSLPSAPPTSSASSLSSMSGAMEVECEKCQEKVTILPHSQLDKDQTLARPSLAASPLA